MSIAEKLVYIKKLRHMTTEEIAQRSGVPVGTLNKIFSGQTKNPAVGPVDKITRVLQIPIQYLLDDDLPVECNIPTCKEDGCILFLSSQEVQLLTEFRSLDERYKQSVQSMITLLGAPPMHLAGSFPVRRALCYVSADMGVTDQWTDDPCFFRPVLIPETDRAAREAEFAVLLSNGSMEPLYPAGSILLCKRTYPHPQEYGLFRFNQQILVRRLCRRRGTTKLVAPNLDFKDIIIHPDDTLEYLGTVIGCARSCRLE
ncbi:XRE family transcriptional regulator [Flavonifractor hominis]|uniref:S24 family peptidase n=1 Tax=Flavonifractor hominis TaxID=3133178 RepID=A0ABV1EKZ8_9FIRM